MRILLMCESMINQQSHARDELYLADILKDS